MMPIIEKGLEVSTLDVLKITHNLRYSQRQGWRVKKRLHEWFQKEAEKVSEMTKLVSAGLYLMWFMSNHMFPQHDPLAIQRERLNKIEVMLEGYQEEFGLDEMGKKVVD